MEITARFIIKEQIKNLLKKEDVKKDFTTNDEENYKHYSTKSTRLCIPVEEDESHATLYFVVGDQYGLTYTSISNGIQPLYPIATACYKDDKVKMNIVMNDLFSFKKNLDQGMIMQFFKNLLDGIIDVEYNVVSSK